MRIWGPHKNSWIRIQESGSTCIRIEFGMIRGSGPRPDPESVAFCILMSFFKDPDPRIRIRVRVSPNSFRKNFNMIFLKEIRNRAYLLMDPFMFFYSLALKRCGTWFEDWDADPGPKSGSARPPSHWYRSKVRYRTATDYGPGICIRVRIPYLTVRGRILILLWRIEIKLLGDQIRVQYSDPDLPGLVRVIRASHLQDARCPRWRGQSRKTTTGPKSGLKIKIYLKIKVFASSGSQRTWICKLRIWDLDPDLNPDPGLNRWHQSGGGSAARRWIRPGLRYH